ncbi:hypothetical protein RYZ26_09615 [Terasakiella sp. A23]|uniref:hypothetical protein n=1 Tax=Terasakiella sp. FCG-A23 TaxID=3080561 RepID=UPI00295321A1|nr:hypothetical protein [Terasakiella sp. A23]MDV7339850.1 hypothetical protein [Terasakiella sp. A23]
MITQIAQQDAPQATNEAQVRDYAERLLLSMGYNDAICTAMEFQWFNVAEELRFMQDDYRGVA